MPVSTEAKDLAEYWQGEINRWRTSGESQASFCKTNNLNYHRFTYWRRKLDERSIESGGFALIKYRSADSSTLSVALPNGLVVQGIESNNLRLARELLASLT